jgi:hypothetical protein
MEKQLRGWGACKLFAGGESALAVESSRLHRIAGKFSALARDDKLGSLQAALLALTANADASAGAELAFKARNDREEYWANLLGALLEQFLNNYDLPSALPFASSELGDTTVSAACSAWSSNESACCFLPLLEDEFLGCSAQQDETTAHEELDFVPRGNPLAELDSAVANTRAFRGECRTINAASFPTPAHEGSSQIQSHSFSHTQQPSQPHSKSPSLASQQHNRRSSSGIASDGTKHANLSSLGGSKSSFMSGARRAAGGEKRKREVQREKQQSTAGKSALSNVISIEEAASAAQKTEELSKEEQKKTRADENEEHEQKKQAKKHDAKVEQKVMRKRAKQRNMSTEQTE